MGGRVAKMKNYGNDNAFLDDDDIEKVAIIDAFIVFRDGAMFIMVMVLGGKKSLFGPPTRMQSGNIDQL